MILENTKCHYMKSHRYYFLFSKRDYWSCPTFGLASVLMLRPISPELVLFPDFEFRPSRGTSVLLLQRCMHHFKSD